MRSCRLLQCCEPAAEERSAVNPCQSALEWDPLSASKRDPFDRRVLMVALAVGAGRGCGDGASAGCLIVVAAFKAPTVVTGLDDVTVMSEPVEQRGGHLGIAEHAGPLSEGEVGGDDDGGALVKPTDEVEQKLAAGLCERQVAQLVENDEVHAGQMFGEPALSAVAGLGLETIDEVDDIVEASSGAIADTASRDGDGQMGLAGARSADEHDVALLGDEAAAGEI